MLSDQTVNETLKMMKRQPDESLTKELATQVCLRNGNKALLTGSIAKVGERYHLDLRTLNCVTGTMLASADADVDSKEHVIASLKQASNELRQKLGESLASVNKYSTPLPQATSSSLEAMKEYAIGIKMKAAQGSEAALPFYKRAVELDPEFADAYAALGAAYSDLGEDTLWRENSRKAYELRDHVSSQRERFHIEGDYYDSVTGEMEKANQTYLDWIQVYPDDHRPHQNLGVNYCDMGQYDRARYTKKKTVLQLQPNNVNGYTGLMGDYLALDQIENAEQCFWSRRGSETWITALSVFTATTPLSSGTTARPCKSSWSGPWEEQELRTHYSLPNPTPKHSMADSMARGDPNQASSAVCQECGYGRDSRRVDGKCSVARSGSWKQSSGTSDCR